MSRWLLTLLAVWLVAAPPVVTAQSGFCCAFPNCVECTERAVSQNKCFASGFPTFLPDALFATCVSNPTSGGDPHFKTWTGIKYDFHGECDLVLVNNPKFASGKGFDLHIRTFRQGYHSSVERAALRIGQDVVEISNQGDFVVNGEPGEAGSTHQIGGFKLYHILQQDKPSVLQLRLGEHEWINFEARHDMLFLAIVGGDAFQGSLGMMGDHETGRMLGRDGETEFVDADEFAQEWQVRETTLFQLAREPQFPAQCLPAGERPKRLGESIVHAAAEAACVLWGAATKADCIFDVVATRNMNVAKNHDVHHVHKGDIQEAFVV